MMVSGVPGVSSVPGMSPTDGMGGIAGEPEMIVSGVPTVERILGFAFLSLEPSEALSVFPRCHSHPLSK
jgi:hypothetical protein